MDWFRLYDEIIDDPKVLSLTPTQRWLYIALLSASNRQRVRGTLPKLEAIATHLRLAAPKVVKLLERLVEAELVDKTETGFAIHGWGNRQRKSDNVAERVAVWRENHPVTLQKRDGHVTSRARSETETETETETPLPPGEDGGLEPFESDPGHVAPPTLPADKQKCLARQVTRFGANGGERVILDLLQDYDVVIVSAACDHHYLDTKGNLHAKQLAGICRAMHNGTWKIPDRNGSHKPEPPPNFTKATPGWNQPRKQAP